MIGFLSSNRRLIGGALAAYIIALLLGTHLPTSALADFSDSDKSLHIVAYVGLGLLAYAYRTARSGNLDHRLVTIVIGLIVFAAGDEFTQRYIAGRVPDVRDWLADVAGVVAAAVVWYLFQAMCGQMPADSR